MYTHVMKLLPGNAIVDNLSPMVNSTIEDIDQSRCTQYPHHVANEQPSPTGGILGYW